MTTSTKGEATMLIGTNTLNLNEATMREALQYWLAGKVLHPDAPTPHVFSVSQDKAANVFAVVLKEEAQP